MIIFKNTLLIVEDDEFLGSGLQFTLEKENWNVRLAINLHEANLLFQSESIDLILLDNHLPDGTGFEFCTKIRQSSDVPIIFLTAADEEVNIVQGLDLGANDYITKPFRLQELKSRIRANLRARTSSHDPERASVRSGAVTLDLVEHKVFVYNEEVRLSALEFKLLSTFMINPKRILERDLLLEKLCNFGGDFVDDNTLSVYIRRLREKIERDPSIPRLIVTVRSIGYKWDQDSTKC
jgi:DNA-binding response OmpR family regulator